jgi:hypothetical protein
MKPNYYHIINRCLDEGIQAAISDHEHLDSRDVEALTERISNEIWCQLDMYFNFDQE